MGGAGSGTWFRWDTKRKTEDNRAINILRWNKKGLLRPGISWETQWYEDGKKDGSIRARAIVDAVILNYRVRREGDEWKDVEQEIPLGRTPCHYGGSRPWFLCPDCKRRVVKLYGAERLFLCRYCYQLTYESQCLNQAFRGVQKALSIHKRLGGESRLFGLLPVRPKGMHRETYNRLLERMNEISLETQPLMAEYLGEFN